MEIWKQIPNYNYEVSNYGRVRNLDNKILKDIYRGKGYRGISLSVDGKKKKFYIHRLVASAFLNLDLFDIKTQIDHIDDDKTNNKVENLQIVSHRENNCKKLRKGTSKYIGVRSYGKKWLSCIRVNNVIYRLGVFDIEEDAHQAYLDALEKFGIQNKYSGIIKDKK